VTGSEGDESLLPDCGLFQGYEPLRLRNGAPLVDYRECVDLD
jgi:hypothetical protein